MKKITIKNYVVALLIIILTFIVNFFAAKVYLEQKELTKNVINLNISEIKVDELEMYIVDNHDCLIYVVDSSNRNEKLEKDLNKIIIKNNYSKDIVYLDLNKINSEYYNNFLKK